jgi:hypothetical protein
MGNVIASCGHRLKSFSDTVHLRALSKEGHPAVRYCVLCPRCLKRARRNGVVLETEADREAWKKGKGEGKIW